MDYQSRTPDIPGIIRPHKRFIYECVGTVLVSKGIIGSTRLSAPIERLEDHTGEIFSCEFHPKGEILLSAGIRPEIHICSVFGKNSRVMIMQGHWCAVMEVHFSSDGEKVYSCSSDQTLGIWDTFTGIRIARLKGHVGCVNAVQSARDLPMLCSGGDDATLRLWDVRQQVNAMTFGNECSLMSTCFNNQGDHIFTGGLGDVIKTYDIRTGGIVLKLEGHKDAVTGLSLSPCGGFLLSHSLDNTLRIWDIRPTHKGERCIQILPSNQHLVNGNLLRCAWSPDGTKVAAGSSDEEVSIFSVEKGVKLDDLPGHSATINDVDFHPSGRIIASASSDNYLFLHEALEW